MKSGYKIFIVSICILVYFSVLFYLFVKWKNEDRLFIKLVSDINLENTGVFNNEDSLIIVSMHAVNLLLNKNNLASLNKDENFNSYFIQSSESELEYVRGACGSYSMVLARVLKTEGFKVRIGQMLFDRIHANHIIVEVQKTNGKWIVLDPFYNLYFRNQDGTLASFEEVRKNWDFYKQDVPPHYYHEYRYKAIRYTNWNRFLIVGRGIRKILIWTIGEEKTSKLSIRTYILNKYRIFFYLVMVFYFPIFGVGLFLRRGIQKYFFKARSRS